MAQRRSSGGRDRSRRGGAGMKFVLAAVGLAALAGIVAWHEGFFSERRETVSGRGVAEATNPPSRPVVAVRKEAEVVVSPERELPGWCSDVVAIGREGITDGLLFTMPFDGNVDAVFANGLTYRALFHRMTPATNVDFSEADIDRPRFVPTRFGNGILMENGWTGYDFKVPGVMNCLSSASAGAETVSDASGAPDGFSAIKSAELAAADVAVQGGGSLKVRPGGAGGGFATDACVPHMGGTFIGSVYLKGAADDELEVRLAGERLDGKPIESKPTRVKLTGEWQRAHVLADAGKAGAAAQPAPDAKFLRLEVISPGGGGEFYADALMVEPDARYHGRREPSSWIPGQTRRMSDTLVLPNDERFSSAAAGTISMMFTPTALGCASRLANIGDGWRGTLRLTAHFDGKRQTLTCEIFGKSMKGRADFRTGTASHVAATWDDKQARLYFEGGEIASVALPAVAERKFDDSLAVGGTADISSPNLKADGVLDDFSVFARALAPEEIGTLAQNERPMIERAGVKVRARLLTPCAAYGRDEELARVVYELSGLKSDVREAVLAVDEYGIEGAVTVEKTAAGATEIAFDFRPAFLMPGNYGMRLFVLDGEGVARSFARRIEICPARVRWENFQVLQWNSFSSDTGFDHGITIAGDWFRLTPAHVDARTRCRMYSQENIRFMGEARGVRNPVDLCWGRQGPIPTKATIGSSEIRRQIGQAAREVAERAAAMPGFRAAIINSEKPAGSHSVSFHPDVIRIAKERFGLDLKAWLEIEKDLWMVDLPGGRLNPFKAKGMVPADRIVPLDHPLYAFMRWYHGPDGVTETVLNDIYAEEILKSKGDFFAIFDPVLRRPTIRAYRRINVAQDWTYYADPKAMIDKYEEMLAVSKVYDGMWPSGMPQFLLKPGVAAPFEGNPTVDMFREACWLTVSRPARLMAFWNFGSILGKKANFRTPEEIEKELGGALDWKGTEKVMKEKKLSFFAWTEELGQEFKRFSREVWRPYGGLFPRWRNSPRRIAVLKGFAGCLFSNQRWRDHGWLMNQVLETGLPFDVLLDEDFETAGFSLQYDAVFLPECHALAVPVFNALDRYIKNGGTVVVDGRFTVPLGGVTRVAGRTEKDSAEFRKKEKELLEKYGGRTEHPQFIEAIEALMEERSAGGVAPEIREIIERCVKPDVKLLTPDVCINRLHGAGGEYAVIVNDLRRPGPIYGRYQKIRERGVVQKDVRVAADAGAGAYVYDLVSRRRVRPIGAGSGGSVYSFDLGPCDGRIILFLRRPVGAFTFERKPEVVRRGAYAEFQMRVSVEGASGELVDGLIPLRLDLLMPDGRESDLSEYSVIERGRFMRRIPFAVNAPAGRWKLRAVEYATGGTVECEFDVR